MAQTVAPVGLRGIGGGVTTPVDIDAGLTLTLPTSAQRGEGGVLIALIQVEAQAARWTVNGTTPTTAVGILLAPTTATVQNTLRIEGEDALTAFQIISASAGSLMTYQFFRQDNRG